jgi:hypothetical protein
MQKMMQSEYNILVLECTFYIFYISKQIKIVYCIFNSIESNQIIYINYILTKNA